MTAAVRTFIGTPFRHQGRKQGVGVDCVGLLWGSARKLGIDLMDYVRYSPRGAPEEFMQLMAAQLDRVEIDTSAAGEGQWWSVRILKQPRHLLYFTGTTVIHATMDAGAVCEHGMDPTIEATGAWRLRWQP